MATLKPLYFDIETVPLYELTDAWMERRPRPDFEHDADGDLVTDDAAKLAEQVWVDQNMKQMALQPEACKMVALNVIMGDGDPKSGWVGELSPKGEPYTEADLLTMFWAWVAQCPRLIGFNCINFDLKVILSRSAMLGVVPTKELYDVKPWESTIIDLMQRRFKGTARETYLSLKALRRLLGFEVPEQYAEVLDNTGGDIEGLYLQFIGGDDAEALRVLKLYGELDVWTTKKLAQLWSGYFFQRIE